MAELVREVPTSYKIFEDRGFRNRVNEYGLVKTVPNIEDLKLAPKDGAVLSPDEDLLVDKVNSEPGHVFPYSAFFEADKIDQAAMHYLQVVKERLLPKLENPDHLTVVNKLGMGSGILEHGLQPAEVGRLIYALDSIFGKKISATTLVSRLYPNTEPFDARYLNTTVFRFREAMLEETKVRIKREKRGRAMIGLTWQDTDFDGEVEDLNIPSEADEIWDKSPFGFDSILNTVDLGVLRLLSEGMRTRDLAVTLGSNSDAISQRLDRLYKKLGVHSRKDAVSKTKDLGLLT